MHPFNKRLLLPRAVHVAVTKTRPLPEELTGQDPDGSLGIPQAPRKAFSSPRDPGRRPIGGDLEQRVREK